MMMDWMKPHWQFQILAPAPNLEIELQGARLGRALGKRLAPEGRDDLGQIDRTVLDTPTMPMSQIGDAAGRKIRVDRTDRVEEDEGRRADLSHF
jgi:hypothetical protein